MDRDHVHAKFDFFVPIFEDILGQLATGCISRTLEENFMEVNQSMYDSVYHVLYICTFTIYRNMQRY